MQVAGYIETRHAEIRRGLEEDERARQIAERVARTFNTERLIKKPTHLVLSGEGWYPRLTDQPYGWPPNAIVLELRDDDMSVAEVLDQIAWRDFEVEERGLERSAPACDGARRRSGWGRGGQPQCATCRKYISSPLALCECGYDNGAQRYRG